MGRGLRATCAGFVPRARWDRGGVRGNERPAAMRMALSGRRAQSSREREEVVPDARGCARLSLLRSVAQRPACSGEMKKSLSVFCLPGACRPVPVHEQRAPRGPGGELTEGMVPCKSQFSVYEASSAGEKRFLCADSRLFPLPIISPSCRVEASCQVRFPGRRESSLVTANPGGCEAPLVGGAAACCSPCRPAGNRSQLW